MEYAPRDPGYKELSEREYPDLWGYYWGEGARKRYARVHQNPHKQRRPISLPAQDPHLAEDGLFGPQTEKAVARFQCRCGIPDDGIVGPETWDLLIPLYRVTIVVFRRGNGKGSGGGTGPGTGSGTTPQASKQGPAVPATRQTTIDNIAKQAGIQVDQSGTVSAVLVMQATWKTSTLPNEFLPGHWEHTGGAQLNIPVGSRTGQNLQAFYQITRAEVLDVKISDEVKITGDLFVQPYVQVPLDSGTPSNPNVPRIGINAGGTVQVEIKPDENSPTVKVFVQGAGGGSVGPGGAAPGASVFTGISVEYDFDRLFGGPAIKRPGPVQGDAIQVDPARVELKPGGQARVRITVANAPNNPASIFFSGLPQGVPQPFANIMAGGKSTTAVLTADANAPMSESLVAIKYLGEVSMAPATTSLLLVVTP